MPLVEGLPPEEEEASDEESGLIILLETTHPTPLDSIVIRLEEEGIPYVVQSGTALSLLEGVVTEILPADWKAVVLVPREHLQKAKQIVNEAAEQSDQ